MSKILNYTTKRALQGSKQMTIWKLHGRLIYSSHPSSSCFYVRLLKKYMVCIYDIGNRIQSFNQIVDHNVHIYFNIIRHTALFRCVIIIFINSDFSTVFFRKLLSKVFVYPSNVIRVMRFRNGAISFYFMMVIQFSKLYNLT